VTGPIWPPLPGWFTSTMLALNIAVGGTIVFTLLAVFASQRRDALAGLRQEQARAENLLLNILPRSIADKLKSQTQRIADQFESASILFADVVDFTPWSERLPAAEVVGYLDHLFSHFDELAERYGLEKIKTIGDCYMVAAGVPTPRPDHACALALMALDMLEAMRSADEVGHLGLELRVGINSGPVVAGVIGRKRFLYDLWGDAVNTASAWSPTGRRGGSRSLARRTSCSPASSSSSRVGRSRSRGRARSRRGTSSVPGATARQPATTEPARRRSPTRAPPEIAQCPDRDRQGLDAARAARLPSCLPLRARLRWSIYRTRRSHPVAIGGKRDSAHSRGTRANPVAVRCDRLRPRRHDEEEAGPWQRQPTAGPAGGVNRSAALAAA
jgi:class 3 adenylate cyclase